MSDVDLNAQGDISVEGDVTGRDKVSAGGDVVGRDRITTYEAPVPIAQSLHQLPAPPRDFTGRQTELDELMAQVRQRGITITGLRGLGGIGKTALALVLAERLAPDYPDAQFYVNLKGASDAPMTPAEAMAHVIRAYHPTAKLPESQAELHPLYCSVLHSQRALLLLDDARGAAQVEPLLPPKSCLVLVTSRQHFALPGLYAKDLNVMPEDEATALLLRIAERIDGHAGELARLCGYLPLALRVSASALAERAMIGVDTYVERLKDAGKRLELVDASLSLSCDLLEQELQQLWRSLAVFPADFAVDAAAAVWGIGQETAAEALDELRRYSLVEWEEAAGRCRLHDLARLFAEAKVGDEGRYEAQRPTRLEMMTQGPTAEEEAIVSEHFACLQGLTERGVVILAGRMLNTDPSSFGIVIFKAESEQAARAVMNDDPAVQKGVMRANLYPYRIALMARQG
jgi:uncharacterized protein YciI